MKEEKEELKIPECCTGCLKFDQFKHECWVYWEGKQDCSQHSEKDNLNI